MRCLVCGVRFIALTKHLRTHGLTAKEYRERFPDAATVCEEIRQKQVAAGRRYGRGKDPRVRFADDDVVVGRAPQKTDPDTSMALDSEVNPMVQGFHGLIVER